MPRRASAYACGARQARAHDTAAPRPTAPGAKRGRCPPPAIEVGDDAQGVPKKPRGAPKKHFVHDPERFAISRADAFMALGASETTPSLRSRLKCSVRGGREEVGPRRKRGRGLMPLARSSPMSAGDRRRISRASSGQGLDPAAKAKTADETRRRSHGARR